MIVIVIVIVIVMVIVTVIAGVRGGGWMVRGRAIARERRIER